MKRAADIIKSRVVPAYRSFLEFMTNEYLPNCRSTLGASELPNGREYYAYLVRHHTTLDLTPEEIHQTGLQEVARIRAEMDHVIEQVGFQGSFEQFLQFLRTDPRFYAQSGEELLKEASWIAKKMDGKLPSLFKTLPRLPYGVEPVPDHLAPKYTAGRYVGAPRGSTRPGYYWGQHFCPAKSSSLRPARPDPARSGTGTPSPERPPDGTGKSARFPALLKLQRLW